MNDELLPLSFDPVSNGEFLPPPKSARDREAERRIHRIAEKHAARTGVTRRKPYRATDAPVLAARAVATFIRLAAVCRYVSARSRRELGGSGRNDHQRHDPRGQRRHAGGAIQLSPSVASAADGRDERAQADEVEQLPVREALDEEEG